MTNTLHGAPAVAKPTDPVENVSEMTVTDGEVEFAGRRYITPERLADKLDVTQRTLSRWDAMRIGPPKIKVGKLVLFDLEKLPDWLASREAAPRHQAGRRR